MCGVETVFFFRVRCKGKAYKKQKPEPKFRLCADDGTRTHTSLDTRS